MKLIKYFLILKRKQDMINLDQLTLMEVDLEQVDLVVLTSMIWVVLEIFLKVSLVVAEVHQEEEMDRLRVLI